MRYLTLALFVAGCAPTGGGGGGGAGIRGDATTADGGPPGDGAMPGDAAPDAATDAAPLPANVFATPHAVNIVDPEAAANVERFLTQQDLSGLHAAARAFYEIYGDDYDFLYTFSQREVPNAPGGVFRHAHPPNIPEIGLMGGDLDPAFGSAERLRGAVAVNFFDGGNGPTIHETFHYWGVFLDRSFGFGRDRDNEFGAHWGLAGVMGQMGGFDPESIECVDPAGAPPPCTENAQGEQEITIGSFGPTANGGDGIPYAPIELYLMGVLPAAEVPSPILVIEDGHFVEYNEATQRLRFAVGGFRQVTIQEIIDLHGERPPADEADRNLRAAFVLFSDEPLPAAALERLDHWARVFGNIEPSNFLESFESATGGRATMDVRLGPPR